MSRDSLYRSELRTIHAYPKVNAYYFMQWNGYEMEIHAHPEIEIMYVIDGKCVIQTQGEMLTMNKGDFILIDSDVPHRLIVEKNQSCRMLNLEFVLQENQLSTPSIRQLGESDASLFHFLTLDEPYILLKDSCELSHLLRKLVLEMDQKVKGQDMMFHLIFAQMFVLMARLVTEQKNETTQLNMYVKDALSYIHQHYDCDIQVKDIAAVVNLHPGYFHRIFKQHVGCSVIEYLASVRMDKAKMLLADTNIPLGDVPDYVGINSTQYFSALFKKHTNETPLSYRKKHQSVKKRDKVTQVTIL